MAVVGYHGWLVRLFLQRIYGAVRCKRHITTVQESFDNNRCGLRGFVTTDRRK